MQPLKIIIPDEESTDVSLFGSCIDTGIYVQTDSFYCFPDETWTDMTERVLYTWAENMMSHLHSDRARFKLYFFDGPYYLEVEQEGESISIQGANFRDEPNKTEFSINWTKKGFVKELMKALYRLKWIALSAKSIKDQYQKNIIAKSCDYYTSALSHYLEGEAYNLVHE